MITLYMIMTTALGKFHQGDVRELSKLSKIKYIFPIFEISNIGTTAAVPEHYPTSTELLESPKESGKQFVQS